MDENAKAPPTRWERFRRWAFSSGGLLSNIIGGVLVVAILSVFGVIISLLFGQCSSSTPTPTLPVASAEAATPTQLPPLLTVTETPSGTIVQATAIPVATLTVTPSPVQPTPSPTPSPTPTPTRPTPAFEDEMQRTLNKANDVNLHALMDSAARVHLREAWQGIALTTLILDIDYLHRTRDIPKRVRWSIYQPISITPVNTNMVTVKTEEEWCFEFKGCTVKNRYSEEYTLERRDSAWFITRWQIKVNNRDQYLGGCD